MIKETSLNQVPSFALVKERINAIDPNVEILEVGLDGGSDAYLLKLQRENKRTTMRLSQELLDDLPGKNNDHRKAQLDQEIHSAIGRMQ